MKKIVYLRVSTEEQKKEGYSIEVQLERILKTFNLNKNEVEIINDAGFSASETKSHLRKGYKYIMQLLEKNQKLDIYAYSQDRLHRSIFNLNDFLKKLSDTSSRLNFVIGDSIDFANDNYEYHDCFSLISLIKGYGDQRTVRQISQKTKDSLRKRFADGCWICGKEPFGTYVDKDHKLHYDENKEIVIEIYNLYYYEGYSKSEIDKYIVNKYPDLKWHRNKASNILKNPIYFGYRVIDGKKYYLIEPLFDEEKLKSIKINHVSRKIYKKINIKHRYLFRNKLIINNKIPYVETHLKKSGKIFKYYGVKLNPNDKLFRINELKILKKIENHLDLNSTIELEQDLQVAAANKNYDLVNELINKIKNMNNVINLDQLTSIKVIVDDNGINLNFIYENKEYNTFL